MPSALDEARIDDFVRDVEAKALEHSHEVRWPLKQVPVAVDWGHVQVDRVGASRAVALNDFAAGAGALSFDVST